VRRWVTVPILAEGPAGEAQDEMVITPPRVKILRNALLVGPGRIRQAPDWLKSDTLKNLAGSPVEGHAVCGVFPFTQQGGASAPSAGIAFSFNSDDNKVYLHQVGETGLVLRTFTAFASYLETLPPQLTGFEMFGKFYFAEYAREVVANRQGLSVFDPTGAGAIAHPTFDLVPGGAGAAVLRFRGISNHRGGTILGWGYRDEEAAGIDQPHVLRYSRYGEPDTWVPDTTDQSAGFINVGTLNLPIVACAMAGQLTILGKEQEIFALDGDFASQFYYRRIGRADGPVSSVGMVSTGEICAWMSLFGPCASVGDKVDRIAVDRDVRRFLSYMDLTTAWGAHDAARTRVVWALRRKEDDDGQVVTNPYLTDLLWWDYQRQEFGVQSLPTPVFCLGTIRGLGQQLNAPTGVVSAITASSITPTGAVISWTPGDQAPDVTFELQYRKNGSATGFISAGRTPPATYSKQLTQLDPDTLYDVEVRQIRNAQFSAFTVANALFRTLVASSTPDPTGATVQETGEIQLIKGKIFSQVLAKWTPFVAANTVVRLYKRPSGTVPGPFDPPQGEAGPGAGARGILDPSFELAGEHVYYWLRTEATDGSGITGEFTRCVPFPLFITGRL
jgi:hypothetical protein